jgi:hypothetical protein
MKRTQLITLLLVLFTGIGFASAKPKVAVLGLEVLDKANAKASIDAARQLTEGLRLAAKTSGPFDVADNSQREFLDEKIINQCESEQRECLLKIAGNFGATSLVYGKLQLTENKKSFQVTVFLLAADKGAAKPAITSVPVTSSPQDLQTAGKKIYNELVGVGSVGSIVIKAKTSKGIVYINGDMRGQLVDGELKATQLADGEYKVKITADGFKKWEETVKVKAGQATVVEPDLEAEAKPAVIEPEDKGSRPVTNDGGGKDPYKLETRENTISHGGSRMGWKIAAVGGAVIAAGSVVWIVKESKTIDEANEAAGMSMGPVNTVSRFAFFKGCSADDAGSTATTDGRDAYVKGCKAARYSSYAGLGIGVGAAVAIVGVYMGFIRSDSSESSSASASTRRARRERFSVTPIVLTDGGGATVRLDF